MAFSPTFAARKRNAGRNRPAARRIDRARPENGIIGAHVPCGYASKRRRRKRAGGIEKQARGTYRRASENFAQTRCADHFPPRFDKALNSAFTDLETLRMTFEPDKAVLILFVGSITAKPPEPAIAARVGARDEDLTR